MKALKLFLAALFVLTLGFSIQGCSSLTGSNTPSQGDDFYDDSFFEDMNFDINDENGGYDSSREEPGFGDASFFSMFTEDEPASDPWSNDPGIIAMGEDPSNVVAYARLVWGQLQFNPESTDSTDWSGSIWVDSGALVVKRLIRLEPDTDWVEERVLPNQIDLVSETSTHNDGLLIQVINDEPGLGDTNLLHVELGDFVYSVPVDSLDAYTEVVEVDEAGNQFSLHSVRVLDCPNGFMSGIWVDGETDAGIFRGGWFSWEGELMGHYRGHWGISDDGENVLRGKLIDLDGNFWAMLRGRWMAHLERHGDGDYRGQWLTPIGEEGSDEFEAVGSIWGFYRKGFMSRGHMGGRWMEWCE